MSFYDHPDKRWQGEVWQPAPNVGEPTSLRGLRTALTVLLAVMAGISALTVVAYLLRIGYAGNVIGGGGMDGDRAELLDGLIAVCYVLWVLGLLATAPVFIVWQYRHAKNARLLGSTSWGPGWAVGGWFIPLANLFIPARQLYVSSRYADPRGRAAGVVVGWWIALTVATVVDRGMSNMEVDGLGYDYLRELRVADGMGVAAEAFFILAAALGIVMVRRLGDRQQAALTARRQMNASAPSPYGTWPTPPSPYGPTASGPAPSPYGPPPNPSGDVPAPPPVPPPA